MVVGVYRIHSCWKLMCANLAAELSFVLVLVLVQ